MQHIVLRNAQLSDLPQIRQLFFETITNVNVKDYSPNEIKVWSSGADNIERWEQKFKTNLFVVAELNDEIVGFTSLKNFNYIDHLFVSYLHQGKRIASQLIDCVEDFAIDNKVDEIQSDVSITALPFFEKRGYVVLKRNEIPLKGETLVNFDVCKYFK